MSTRQRFYAALLRAASKGPMASINMKSMADGIGCHRSLLTRYLKQVVDAGWVRSAPNPWGMEIEVLDRDGLTAAAGLNPNGGETDGRT